MCQYFAPGVEVRDKGHGIYVTEMALDAVVLAIHWCMSDYFVGSCEICRNDQIQQRVSMIIKSVLTEVSGTQGERYFITFSLGESRLQ